MIKIKKKKQTQRIIWVNFASTWMFQGFEALDFSILYTETGQYVGMLLEK